MTKTLKMPDLDVNKIFENGPGMNPNQSGDGVHPNGAGYTI